MKKTNENKKNETMKNEKPLMQHLPEEIIIEILSRLPPQYLLKCRCVSKPWSVLFNNPKLIDMIKNNFSIMLVRGNDIYSIDNESLSSSLLDGIERKTKIHCPVVGNLSFVGHCNGLVCILTNQHCEFILWNPSTGDCKGIPSPPQFQVEDSLHRPVIEHIYGFGYDLKSDDYKFVHIAINHSNFIRSEVKMYSLNSNSWKRIQHSPCLLSSRGYGSQCSGVFCNGALHWQKCSFSEALIALDMTDEQIVEISKPKSLDVTSTRTDVLDGCLCMLCCTYDLGFEVWLMKDYGKKESWIRIYSIPKPAPLDAKWLRCLRRIECLKTGEILLEVHYGNMTAAYRQVLVLYDPESEMSTILKLDEFSLSSNPLSSFQTYVKSSVSRMPPHCSVQDLMKSVG